MRSLLVLLLGLFAVSSVSFADFKETNLLRLDGSQITFYLDQPKAGSFPIILFLQGSECHSAMGRSSMPQNPSDSFGTGFLMIEKYGITKEQVSDEDDKNCTTDFLRMDTLDQRIIDALKVISYLRAHASSWNRELLIVGGSEGGMLAPILASLIPETKKVAMLVAGNGRAMLEDTREALALTARQHGLNETQVSGLLADYDLKTAEIKIDPSPQKMYLGHTYKWWNSVLWVNPVHWMLDLSVPQLLIHGTADTSVPVASARATSEAFKKAGKTNLTYIEAKECDHALVDNQGVSHKMEYLLMSIHWLLQKE